MARVSLTPDQIMHKFTHDTMTEQKAMSFNMSMRYGNGKAMAHRTNLDLRICPQCLTMFEVRPCREEDETAMHREQAISGICSDDCWDAFLVPDK
jgi:hypothetical protein